MQHMTALTYVVCPSLVTINNMHVTCLHMYVTISDAACHCTDMYCMSLASDHSRCTCVTISNMYVTCMHAMHVTISDTACDCIAMLHVTH